MPRPRLVLPEAEIAAAYTAGTPIAALARAHGVDRSVIRRILVEADLVQNAELEAVVVRLASHVPAGFVTGEELGSRALLTSRQVEHWTWLDVLRPRERTPRAGMPRVFPESEVQVAALTRRLVRAGVHLREASALARELADTGRANLAGMQLRLLDFDAAQDARPASRRGNRRGADPRLSRPPAPSDPADLPKDQP